MIKRFGFIVHGESDDPAYYKAKALASEKMKYKLLRPLIWATPAVCSRGYLRSKGCFVYANVIERMPDGQVIEAVVLGIPWSEQSLIDDQAMAFDKICGAIQLGIDKYGIELADLGAYTAIVCENGLKVANEFNGNIPVIGGNYLTTYAGLEGGLRAHRLAGFDLANESVAIIGGGGSIGKLSASYLANQMNVGQILLVGREGSDLSEVVESIGCDNVSQCESLQKALEDSSLVICAVSDPKMGLNPLWLRRGGVVEELSRPRAFSEEIYKYRTDVIVVAGGMMRLPGEVESDFLKGTPPDEHYGCISEGFLRMKAGGKLMQTAVGKNLDMSQFMDIRDAAKEHGFKLGHFRPCDDKFFDRSVIYDYFTARVEDGALSCAQAAGAMKEFLLH